MRRALGIILALIGLFLFLDGVTVAAGIGWGNDVDLSTGGKTEVGLAFGVFGLTVIAAGWALVRPSR